MRRITTLPAAPLLRTSPATGVLQSPRDNPSVVLIMTDDAGFADIGSYGASDIRTPNIDSLARDGVRPRTPTRTPCHARRHEPDSFPAGISSVTGSSS